MTTCTHLVMDVTTTFGNVMLGTCAECCEPMDREIGHLNLTVEIVGGRVRGGNTLLTYPGQ